MAISRGSSAQNSSNAPFSFNNVAGNFLEIWVTGDLGSDNISAITYNGVSMTQGGKVIDAVDRSLYGYILANPATGSNTVSITASGGGWNIAQCVSYLGVKSVGQPDNSATKDEAGVSSQTVNITTVADKCWLTGVFHTNSAKTFTNGTNTNTVLDDGGTTQRAVDSNGPITPAGATSMSMSYNTAAAFAEAIVFSISPTPNIGNMFLVL